MSGLLIFQVRRSTSHMIPKQWLAHDSDLRNASVTSEQLENISQRVKGAKNITDIKIVGN